MKEIKDYLHLYLGCDVKDEYDDDIKKLHSVSLIDCMLKGRSYHDRKFEEIKPILRPLNDMTFTEWKDNWTYFSVGVGNAVQSGYVGSSDKPKHVIVLENRLNTNTLTFNDGMILLRMHFDLFNLIPEKLAIDKTTL